MIAQFEAEVHGFDPTPMSLEWLSRQQIPPAMHVSAVGISDHDGEEDFAFPHVAGWDDFSVRRKSDRLVRCRVARLATVIGNFGLQSVDIAKLDVEGSEYKVIADLGRSSVLPRQFLVEFHHGMHGIVVQETKGRSGPPAGAGLLPVRRLSLGPRILVHPPIGTLSTLSGAGPPRALFGLQMVRIRV